MKTALEKSAARYLAKVDGVDEVDDHVDDVLRDERLQKVLLVSRNHTGHTYQSEDEEFHFVKPLTEI